MTSTGGPDPSATIDVTRRMEVFGRLFGEQIGVPEPTRLPSPESLVAVVRAKVPRSVEAGDDAPVFEAAAFVGEWLRTRATAAWIAEGPFEPHLQLVDRTHAIVYLLPLVQMVRTASTAGYDGMTKMLDGVLRDVTREAKSVTLDELRVEPIEDLPSVAQWIRAHRDIEHATRAALRRRCAVCARVDERSLTLHRPGDDWEGEAATAASILSSTPFECPCGGPPGAITRFLMIRHEPDGATRFGDIYVSNTHTRVGCWTIQGDRAEPFDALALTMDERLTG